MKRLVFIILVSIVVPVCLFNSMVYAKAGDNAYSTIKLEFWLADIKSDTSEGDVTFSKLSFSTVTAEDLFLQIAMMIGNEDYEGAAGEEDGSTEAAEEDGSTDVTSVDLIAGASFDIFDVGAGFRYWENDYKGHGTTDEIGPIVYLGIHQPLAETPLSVYARFSWNFVDWGDTEEREHFTIEPGISCFLKPVTLGVGYQIKDYYDYDYRYKGAVVSVGFVF